MGMRSFLERYNCTVTARTSLLRSEEHTSELQSQSNLVCRLLLEKKKKENDGSTIVAQCGSHAAALISCSSTPEVLWLRAACRHTANLAPRHTCLEVV